MVTNETPSITPLRYIRKHVFRMQQQEFADHLGRSRVNVSKYETGLVPLPYEIMERVRGLASEREIAWDDRWFFEVPAQEVAA